MPSQMGNSIYANLVGDGNFDYTFNTRLCDSVALTDGVLEKVNEKLIKMETIYQMSSAFSSLYAALGNRPNRNYAEKADLMWGYARDSFISDINLL